MSIKDGVQYSCKNLDPITTLRLTYTNPRGLEYLKIITENPYQTTHFRDKKLFIVILLPLM
nr:hypothetical protein BAR15_90035 [Bartonella sp. AR 15-3]